MVPTPCDCVHICKPQIGVITAAVKSPILGKGIAVASLNVTHAEHCTEVEVVRLGGDQKRLKTRVVRCPHFDPTEERAKGNYRSRPPVVRM